MPEPTIPCRVLVLGATGCVGRLLVQELRDRPQFALTLSARHPHELEKLAARQPRGAAVQPLDLTQPEAVRAALRTHSPDIVVHVAGRYQDTGMIVAEAVLDHGAHLVDICDEPVQMRAFRSLHERARGRGKSFVVGSGCAPQTSGALLRLATQGLGQGYDVKLAFCLGLNRYGPNAVQTVAKAVAGMLSVGRTQSLWRPGPTLTFPPPFGRRQVRDYPLPESVFLDELPGVGSWWTGACLSSGFLNKLVAIVCRLNLVSWGRWRLFNAPIAHIGTYLFNWRFGHCGLGIAVEARQGEKVVSGTLFHPEMSELTAQALVITLEALREGKVEPGVWWGQDVLDPASFLRQLETSGAVWEMKGP